MAWSGESVHVTTQLCTAHCTLNTAHCTLHTAPCTLYITHCILHTAYYTLHTAHWTLHITHCTLQAAYFTLYNKNSTLLSAQYTLHMQTAHWIWNTEYTFHTARCTIQTAKLTLHTAFWTLHTTHCIVYTLHNRLHIVAVTPPQLLSYSHSSPPWRAGAALVILENFDQYPTKLVHALGKNRAYYAVLAYFRPFFGVNYEP